MRLSEEERRGIKEAVAEVFGPDATVRLFGSRVDDSRRGGDIDLLVEVPAGRTSFGDECALAQALETRIGARRVDALLVEPGCARRPIEEIAYRDGKLLSAPPGAAPIRPPREAGWDWGLFVTEDQVKLRETAAAGRQIADGLKLSLEELAGLMPLSGDRLRTLDRSAHKDVLAFLKAFEQLQDLTSNRLVRGVLILLAEETVGLSARDAYDKAEKAGALADAERFIRIARLRHRLIHEYPMDDDARASRVNDAYALAPALLDEFELLAAWAARLADGEGT